MALVCLLRGTNFGTTTDAAPPPLPAPPFAVACDGVAAEASDTSSNKAMMTLTMRVMSLFGRDCSRVPCDKHHMCTTTKWSGVAYLFAADPSSFHRHLHRKSASIMLSLWSLLAGLGAVCGGLVLVSWLYRVFEWAFGGIPGPFPFPLLGNLPQANMNPLQTHRFLLKVCQQATLQAPLESLTATPPPSFRYASNMAHWCASPLDLIHWSWWLMWRP